MREMFDSLLPTAAREGAVLHVTADLEAAALWRPPGAELAFEGPAGARPEVTAAFAAVGARRPAAAHWYLDFLGARNAGQGHGSSLVRHMHSRTDAEGIATALWTGDQRNLGFYGRLGYAVVQHLDLGGAGAWWLWRDPPRAA